MSRYIDADKMIDGYSTTFPYDLSYCDDGDLMEWLDAQPIADVVEVRHGYWFIREYEYFTCSECGHDYYNGCEYTAQAKERLENGEHPNFCPNCGAKMDGERKMRGNERNSTINTVCKWYEL